MYSHTVDHTYVDHVYKMYSEAYKHLWQLYNIIALPLNTSYISVQPL